MLKISYSGCLGLYLAITAQFTLEIRVAAQNRGKFTKTLYFEIPKLFKVINVDISKYIVRRQCLL